MQTQHFHCTKFLIPTSQGIGKFNHRSPIQCHIIQLLQPWRHYFCCGCTSAILATALLSSSLTLTQWSPTAEFRTAAEEGIRQTKPKDLTREASPACKRKTRAVPPLCGQPMSAEPRPPKRANSSIFMLFFSSNKMYFSRPLTILLISSSKEWSRRTYTEIPFSVVSNAIKGASKPLICRTFIHSHI